MAQSSHSLSKKILWHMTQLLHLLGYSLDLVEINILSVEVSLLKGMIWLLEYPAKFLSPGIHLILTMTPNGTLKRSRMEFKSLEPPNFLF